MSTSELASVNGGVGEDRAHQKSFKRKYKKLRHKFKEVMKRSDELFRQEQLVKQAMRRAQEENTRILDFLVDLNESSHLPKERRHNIGSPSRATPPRFLSPTLLATIYGSDPTLLDPNGDVEAMELEEEEARRAEQDAQNGGNESSGDDDDDDDEEEDKTPAAGQGSKYNSDDEEDDNEAYLEEIREWNYKRGIAGTPPRSVREKMKADAEQERKDAEEQAKKAAIQAEAEKSNGIAEAAAPAIKQEHEEEGPTEPGDAQPKPPPLIAEEYRRGRTPEYLRGGSPFLMTLEEEDEWYDEIDEKYDGEIPPLEHPNSLSAAKAEGDPRNPMSVYCWLKKNQPQVFLQGEEAEGKKPGRGRGGGRKKAVEVDSGDEGAGSVAGKEPAKLAGAKRRRTANGIDATGAPTAPGTGGRGRGGGGARGGRKKAAEGEPPAKKQKR